MVGVDDSELMGYVAFQIGIFLARFTSDYLIDRFDRKIVLTHSSCVSWFNLCAIIDVTIIGFLFCGFDNGSIYPRF